MSFYCPFEEDKGPKNYSWRKEMESYEENLEKINSHKKVVHESTKSARCPLSTNISFSFLDTIMEAPRAKQGFFISKIIFGLNSGPPLYGFHLKSKA